MAQVISIFIIGYVVYYLYKIKKEYDIKLYKKNILLMITNKMFDTIYNDDISYRKGYFDCLEEVKEEIEKYNINEEDNN